MYVKETFFSITRIFAKAILGLLIVVLILIALLHLPPTQKQITKWLTNYLSSKMETRVEIGSISFSIRAHILINDLGIWDRQNNKILTAREVEVSSGITNLIKGDFIFDRVRIVGFDGQLVQHEEGLNIQFILDAFASEKSTEGEPKPVVLQFSSVELEDILFVYTSFENGTTVNTRLAKFAIEAAQYSTHPNVIKVDKVMLQQSAVNILKVSHQETVDTNVEGVTIQSNRTDGGAGITVAIADLVITKSDFSYHKNKVITTSKFDPDHIEVSDLQLRLSASLYRDDTLAISLQNLSAQLPGFNLERAAANVRMNPNRLELSGLHLVSGTNEVKADLFGWYDSTSVKSIDHANAKITVDVKVIPNDWTYFLSDSVMNNFKSWDATTIKLAGSYIAGRGDIKQLMVQSGNSVLEARGIVNNVWDADKLTWNDVLLSASMGSAFNSTLAPFLNTVNLPPQLLLELSSSGNLKEAKVNARVNSTWGNVLVNGLVAQQPNSVGLDLTLTGENVDPGKWMDLSWMGPVNFIINTKGKAGEDTNMDVNGVISSIVLLNQSINTLELKSSIHKSDATVTVAIKDPDYQSDIHSEISFAGPLMLTNIIKVDDFNLGSLLHRDSTLTISGNTESTLAIDGSSLDGYVMGTRVSLKNQNLTYLIDSLSTKVKLSPAASTIDFNSEYGKINLVSNFDLRETNDAVQSWSEDIIQNSESTLPKGSRTATITMALEKANLFKLGGIDVDEFSSLTVTGDFDEQKQTVGLSASSGKFKGYGMALDTLQVNLTMLRDSVTANVNAKNMWYGNVLLGDMDVDLRKKGKSAITNLFLSSDTLTLLNWHAHMVNADSGVFVYTDSLRAFDHDFILDPENKVFIEKDNIVMNNVRIGRDSVQISIEGDRNAFEASLKNLDLPTLDLLLFPDTTVVNRGYLNANITYIRDQQLNLMAVVDSLSLYNSNPITITANAVRDGNAMPFQILLTSATNTVNLKGDYFMDNADVEASLALDVNELELFAFLVSDFIQKMDGSLKGEVSIKGPVQKPAVNGYLQFLEVGLTTVNPQLTFTIKDDRITLDNNTLMLNDFTLYDTDQNPLVINGKLTSPDYQSYAYDLHIKSDNYALINNPDSVTGRVSGLLVLDSDIKLKGDEKDTNVEARLKIKDATKLTFVTASNDIELLNAEGIIDFVDPALLKDSIVVEQSLSYYDSLIASLPAFNLNSSIIVEDKAAIRIIIDEQSGDYLETSGGATLDLGYNRTGNLSLSGNYTIRTGVYRLSFYDLVKKNFDLVEGSSITWSGSPENGDLSIKAVHTVESNSIGLIGHEIGENEKSTYKRSLNYEVGININGTIERPIISFSLDLPTSDKTSYPVLANKLDRLRQPEYESELNKQVFGLLVLGGFLPESSGSDFNSSLIATTALSNSVNSLLASQLNKFANQYIRGFNIDVGIQSYSDYSAPGGKTQTAMDFRVSKRIMDDRLSFEIGGDFDINSDQSGANTGTKNYRGDVAIIYDLTGNGDKQLKLFNNETYDIVYQEIRNTGISLIFIREFSAEDKKKKKQK